MAVTISYSYPSSDFWDKYTELWENSIHKPVFKSPHYIQYLANRYKDSFAVFQWHPAGEETLMGAIFFRKDGEHYRMLTDVKADHNFFVIHRDCTPDQISHFFDVFLQKIKQEHWSLILKVQPIWASYMNSFVKTLEGSGLFWNVAKRSVCPILEAETGKALYERLYSSRELRYRINRIKSQLNGEFEILTDDGDLDAWVKKFCELHRKRWDGTDSPSRYTDREEEKFLKNCLVSWIEDGALVRFAIKVDGERIGFVICLIQQNSLIHHSTAYDDEFYKYSPGKALILTIAEWMKDHDLNVLDFGEGAETYKYDYTNREMELNEFTISALSNVSFIIKVKMKQVFREKISENPGLKKFLKERIKPLTKRAKV